MSSATKKKLLIIKSNNSNLIAVETFLRNREWNIKSTDNLKDALIFLVQEKPAFAMVAIDHPNRKISNLPKILMQALGVCVIAFTEDSSSKAFGMLNSCNLDYVLYPPVTGPAVERTVNKFYKDQQIKNQKKLSADSAKTLRADDGVIAIKGDGSETEKQNAQKLLQQLMKGEEPSFLSGSASITSAGTYSENQPISQSSIIENSTINKKNELNRNSATKNSNGASWIPTDNEASPLTDLLNDPKNDDSKNLFKSQPRRRNSSWASQELGAGSTNGYSDYTDSSRSRVTPEDLLKNPSAIKRGSVILRGTQNAVEKSCRKTEYFESEELGECSNVSCLLLECSSSSISGYLMMAMGKNRITDRELTKSIKEKLFHFLIENGVNIKNSDVIDLRLQTVPFEQWSLDQAEFLLKSVHNGCELAMAFFPRENVFADHTNSAVEEMVAISLEELADNVTVDFNVYIYLPQNERYILYTPRGATFHSVQKVRLQNQGVSNLHILKMEMHDLNKYRAQNFFNERITVFHGNGKESVLEEV